MEQVTVTDLTDLAFCPRSLWLRVNGENVPHEDKIRGSTAHEHVDESRSMAVYSDSLSLHGKADVVDMANGDVHLVEYKSVRKDKIPSIRYKYLVQLAAYKLCLEEMGIHVSRQYIWFTEHRRKVEVSDTDLCDIDIPDLVEEARAVAESKTPPPHLEDEQVCAGCPLVTACSPPSQVVLNPKIITPASVRKDLTLGTDVKWVGVSDNQIVVRSRDGEEMKVPVKRISSVVVPKSCSFSAYAVVTLMNNRIPVVFTEFDGKVAGYATSIERPNGSTRLRVATIDEDTGLLLAAESIRCKVLNQAALIGRYGHKDIAKRIRDTAKRLQTARTDKDVFGVEGGAAAEYFQAFFSDMPSWTAKRGSRVRVKRAPLDPVNMVLNVAYGRLRTEVLRAILQCGLDPAAGVLHSSSRNKSALVLDLMEMFRPVVSDTAVRHLFKKRMLSESDFTYTPTGIQFKGKDQWGVVTKVLNDRLSEEHTYVKGGYRMTWGRTIDYVTRGFVQYIDGTRDTWEGVYVR